MINADAELMIRWATDHALLLAAFANGTVELGYMTTTSPFEQSNSDSNAEPLAKFIEVTPTGQVFSFEVDQFGCPILTDEIRAALVEVRQ
jgi:hypothetical protein